MVVDVEHPALAHAIARLLPKLSDADELSGARRCSASTDAVLPSAGPRRRLRR
jgi:hypothetical protein